MTVFDSVGVAPEDQSAPGVMRDAAAERGNGEVVEPVPEAADPENLVGAPRDNPKPVSSQPSVPVRRTTETD